MHLRSEGTNGWHDDLVALRGGAAECKVAPTWLHHSPFRPTSEPAMPLPSCHPLRGRNPPGADQRHRVYRDALASVQSSDTTPIAAITRTLFAAQSLASAATVAIFPVTAELVTSGRGSPFVSALPYLSPAARRQYLQLLPTYATENRRLPASCV